MAGDRFQSVVEVMCQFRFAGGNPQLLLPSKHKRFC